MFQKVVQVGSSVAVTLPKQMVKDLGLQVGDRVEVQSNLGSRAVTVRNAQEISARDREILKMGMDLLRRYRKDFEALAHK